MKKPCPRCKKLVPVREETRQEDASDVFGDDATDGQIADAEANASGEWTVHITVYTCPHDGTIEEVSS